jgi:hypothetical protein
MPFSCVLPDSMVIDAVYSFAIGLIGFATPCT